jgi:sarcosine oxidase delta subunit
MKKKNIRCPKCNKRQDAEVFYCGGRIVNVLMTECGHSFDFQPEKVLTTKN